MPAHENDFPWMSYYGKYNFFEQRMREHSKVNATISITPSLYHIELADDRVIRTFICECYSFDIAEYIEICQELGEIDAVVISSNWCGYSPSVKRHCMNEEVGVYNIRAFMAAINKKNYWEYLTEDEEEYFKENGWI